MLVTNVYRCKELVMQDKGGVFNYPKVQRLLGELCKGKVLKEVRLVDGLFKYKQSRVYMPQGKLRLLVFKEEYDSLIGGHREEFF